MKKCEIFRVMMNCGSKKETSVNKMLDLFISKCCIITYFKRNVLQEYMQAQQLNSEHY